MLTDVRHTSEEIVYTIFTPENNLFVHVVVVCWMKQCKVRLVF